MFSCLYVDFLKDVCMFLATVSLLDQTLYLVTEFDFQKTPGLAYS